MSKMIGLIGGAGVAAAAALTQRIVDVVTDAGARFDQEHPEVVLFQASHAPSRSLFLEGRGPSFVPAYKSAADRLTSFGAGVIAICCNTAHAALPELRAHTPTPIVDLIEESWRALYAICPKASRVGLMSSDGERRSMLYERAARRMKFSISLIHPSAEVQKIVTQGIVGVKRGEHRRESASSDPTECFRLAADYLAAQHVDAIILGCTEIPLAFGSRHWNKRPLIDTIDVLARACLRDSGWTPGAQ